MWHNILVIKKIGNVNFSKTEGQTDEQTAQNYKRGSLKVNLANNKYTNKIKLIKKQIL